MSVISSLAWAMRETGSLGRGEGELWRLEVGYWRLETGYWILDDFQSEDAAEEAVDEEGWHQHDKMDSGAHG